MAEIKDKLITAENLKNAYDDNKRSISELKGDLDNLISVSKNLLNLETITSDSVEQEVQDVNN